MSKTMKSGAVKKQAKLNKAQKKTLVIHSFDAKRGLSLSESDPIYYAIASKKFAEHQQRIHFDMSVYVSFLGDECTLDDFSVKNKPEFLKKSIFKRMTDHDQNR